MGIKRALRYGDGWIPIVGRGGNDMYQDLALFRKMATEAGRDPDSMEVSFYTAPSDVDELKRLRDAGLSRAIFLAFPLPKEQLLPMLDDLEKASREVG